MSARKLRVDPRAPSPPSFVLAGLRASGKSTIGRALAGHLRRPFIDLDELTLARLVATSVSDAWREHGEAAWRDAEFESLNDALGTPSAVIALGGGTLMIPRAQDLVGAMRDSGRLVLLYLHTDTPTLLERLERDPRDRPPLTDLPLEEEVRLVYAQRDPVYRQLADWTLETSNLSPEQVVQRVVELCRAEG
jgi:shikimate kinase